MNKTFPIAGRRSARMDLFGACLCGLITVGLAGEARSQQAHELQCRGVMGDTPAVLSGVRQYASYNSVGDGYVQFNGTVAAGGLQGRMSYEGYTQSGSFQGVIETARGNLSIGVLDNTGGQMIIYGGRPSLGPPDTIGRFVCNWR